VGFIQRNKIEDSIKQTFDLRKKFKDFESRAKNNCEAVSLMIKMKENTRGK
jgi:hypothetical protein